VWVALWQDLSVANVLAGLLVATVVSLVFPLPRLRLATKVHPLHLAVLVLRFLFDVVLASFQVAWLTLQFGRRPKGAVFAANLRSHSDFVLTLVAQMTSLVPGSLAVEVRRHTHTLYVHVLDLGPHDVEHFRRRVLAQERRVLLALGEDLGAPVTDTQGDRP